MKSIWYKTTSKSWHVEWVQVVGYTENFVWIDGHRHGRHNTHTKYFMTKEEAIAHLTTRANDRLHAAHRDIADCEKALRLLKGVAR